MKKIFTVVGARPQFIKASMVSKAIAETQGITEVLVHTGQHYDSNMSDVFFDELDIPRPNHHLGVGGGSHGQNTGRMLEKLEALMVIEKPDVVLVYGDTNSTLAGALAAVKINIPVAHVESGLRSFNMSMPEEVNRILTDRISRWLFTPTKSADENLLREGFSEDKIIRVGDVMYDVAKYYGNKIENETNLYLSNEIKKNKYILVTIHRAENTDDPIRLLAIVETLIKIGETTQVVWPLHPRTRASLSDMNKLELLISKINIINPVGYLEMVKLEKNASLIVTDSGGVQKEAFFYSIPCVTLRNETEWLELIESGWNRLVSPNNTKAMKQKILEMMGSRGREIEPYGNGDSATKIVNSIVENI